MKKLILTVAGIVGVSMAAYSQGAVYIGNNNASANGYVIDDINGHSSSSTASYVQADTFTVQLYALAGNLTSTAGIVGLDQYGYLNPLLLASDGFVASTSGTTLGGSGGSAGAAGVFDNPLGQYVPGNSGTYVAGTGYTQSGVLALVAWTGTYANLAAALAANADVGAIVFVNYIGPGGANPNVPDTFTGWNSLQISPAAAANGGLQDLIMSPVPEPATMALVGLGGLSLLMFRRKQS